MLNSPQYMTNFTSNDETKIKSKKISGFLQSRIEAKDFPSAVYLVAEKGEIVWQDALGLAVVEPKKIEASIDTIYDLASLTKPLITGLICAKLIEDSEISLNDKIYKFIEGFNYKITFQHLLTHTSGYSAWLPFYLVGEKFWIDYQKISKELGRSVFDKSDVARSVIKEQKQEFLPNTKVIYSDLNFIGLGIFLESIYGSYWKRRDFDLEKITQKEIIEPLNLQNTFFNPPKELQKRIAASEKGNEFEKQTCIEQGYLKSSANADGSDFFRAYQIWGEVHDGNCWFMNGVSGHAGLFSTAEEVFKIAQQFLPNQTTLLKPETCKLFCTNFTPGLNEARSIAFQLAETKDSTASAALAKDSFGHLGFTGTSLWIEPETERIFILLTNRTHDHELPFVNINSVRRKFHELATEILNSKS